MNKTLLGIPIIKYTFIRNRSKHSVIFGPVNTVNSDYAAFQYYA